jgi:hypothetical protein
MPGVAVPWPTNAMPGKRPGEGYGDLINAYAVKRGDNLEIRRTPGFKRYIQISDAKQLARGMFATNDRLYFVYDDKLYYRTQNDTDGVITGVLTSKTAPVTFAVNLRPADATIRPGPHVVMVEGDGLGVWLIDQTNNILVPYPDQKLPFVTSVEYYAGYFFFVSPTNDMWASDLQDTSIPDFSTARAEYSSDPLLRLKMDGSSLLAFGARTIEIWTDIGSAGWPLTRQATIDTGLLGQWAVAGGSNRWGNGCFFVANDYTVRHINGSDPRLISNDDVANDIWKCRSAQHDIHACVYDFEQQGIVSITSISQGWTWEFNLATNVWHRRDSYGLNHWRGMWATSWQNRWFVQDTEHARIQEVMPNVYEEDGERMRFRAESAPMKQFPQSMRIPRVDLDMTNALGWQNVPSPYQTNPAAMLSWSKDGGATWSRPVARSFGRIGRYAAKLTLTGLGRSTAHGLRIRCDVVDPVPAVIRGGVAKTKSSGPRAVEN